MEKLMQQLEAVPCTWDGVEYPSIGAAARATGRQPASMWYLLRMNYTGEADLKKPRTGMEWEGKWYATIAQAVRATGEPYGAMRYRKHNGITSASQLWQEKE